ncbi:uncharacterized protein LOC123544577 [Mercenaria mercenaria]|uniref:uncharacterized protein LOC123544577 n=1 Tax=Mercenaria mercenaria TaxID=6596 RepID=UPI00234F7632|nr:uncharacterized protein LOC123544577 [Mercenaria mercenaria]
MSEKESTQTKKYFTVCGDCTDEIKFVFDDGQTLYVSENLLSYASPVFKAMFEHNLKEKTEREVKLTEKNYKDVLEFLLCLHPAVQREITTKNVLDVVGIAEEYQVDLLIMRCKNVMTKWLESELEYVKGYGIGDTTLRERTANCLTILHKALECRYTTVVDHAITIISKFGYGVFSGTLKLGPKGSNINTTRNNSSPSRGNYIHGDSKEGDSKCQKLFSTLPDNIKYRLLVERLMTCDKNIMY